MADFMLSEPAPGTLGYRQLIPADARRVLGNDAIHCEECEGWHHRDQHADQVDVAHLLAEHRALATRYKNDLRDALDTITELTELVVRAHLIIAEVAEEQPDWVPAETWLDDTADIVGEAT